jgi:hypothetical protein
MMSSSYEKVEPVPRRIPLPLPAVGQQPVDIVLQKHIDVVMQEYTAIRREIDTCLANQVAILSFGAATVGLLVAAAATLWEEDPLLPGLLLLFVVPGVCFLALAIHAGELVRLMRAGFFLHELERWVNQAWSARHGDNRMVLTWEQWAIREGRADVDKHNGQAIAAVFGLLALGFTFMGFWRLHSALEEDIPNPVPGILLAASLLIEGGTFLWVARLRTYAYKHRAEYKPRPHGPVDQAGYPVDEARTSPNPPGAAHP